MEDNAENKDSSCLRVSVPTNVRDTSANNKQATTKAVMAPLLRKKPVNVVRKLISNTDAKEVVATLASTTQ
ncbi:hypothetical protein HMPREF9237_01738 [Actinotignum schaalii FB123-CNA-2]|uniref:Uncharacterized protein n=1 Tax=Actinotignum schaalii FB123-CNA-2 TaxID=883067 RepID=S2VEV4_9ACTO|nr:hypothetical protein HMPREF9237_01738 [Actinotignum schaalii FB123-CNA-2]